MQSLFVAVYHRYNTFLNSDFPFWNLLNLRQSFQDKKDFTLEVPINVQNNKVYFKMKKDQIPGENNFHRNKQSIKMMVSTCLTWDEVTKPFFVNGCGVIVNLQTYNDIYRRNFYPPFNLFMYIKSGFLYNTMYHHTVQTLYKIFYKKYSIHVLSKPMDVPLPLPIPLVT